MSIRTLILPVVALAATLSVGCEALDGSSSDSSSSSSSRRDRDRDGISDRYDRSPRDADDRLDRSTRGTSDRLDRDDVVIGRERGGGRDLDGALDRETGGRDSSLRGMSEIPRDAVRVEAGQGQTLRYQAERDGRIYVYDEDDGRVVYTGKLDRGERFVADPERDELSVDGKRLGDINLRAAHRYRVYFARE